MSSLLRQRPSSLSRRAAQPDAFRREWHWRSPERKRPFLFRWRSLEPSDPSLYPSRSSLRRWFEGKRPFPFRWRWQISRSLEPFGLFLHPVLSLRRFASRWPRAWPLLRWALLRQPALFQPPGSSLMVILPAAAQKRRLQPAPANSLSINW